MKNTRTSSRKQQHVEITLSKDVSFRTKTSGFERFEFLHNALPELNFSDIDTTVSFLGKELSFPLIVSSMTGGYKDAQRINRQLAEVCAEKRLAMGVGSQRQAMEDSTYHRSFSVVREVAKNIPVFGNIGAAEVAKLKDASKVQKLAELIHADGFAVHLNPLQEFLQPEGSPDFHGVLSGIELLVRQLNIPILVKEIGAGISRDVAKRLLNVGVRIIDVAGAGGTSWAGVEIIRRKNENGRPSRATQKNGKFSEESFTSAFWDWGIPTVDALRQVCSLKSETQGLTVISSGGIHGGLDVAKSIAFGADLVGAARPMLKALESGGRKGLIQKIDTWMMQVKGAMFLTGSRTVSELQQRQLVLKAQ
ncbi:MAG: type 2 isopentenyl-diphosphate Delta-isomerase [Ignavibacteriales bacterium]|nr:type 2 isopentenyl-diphosphate Delta-isomerase [Ignavibacteriales bacterium]